MNIKNAKYLVIGVEDGWIECRNYKDWKEYLKAKRLTELYERYKILK